MSTSCVKKSLLYKIKIINMCNTFYLEVQVVLKFILFEFHIYQDRKKGANMMNEIDECGL